MPPDSPWKLHDLRALYMPDHSGLATSRPGEGYDNTPTFPEHPFR